MALPHLPGRTRQIHLAGQEQGRGITHAERPEVREHVRESLRHGCERDLELRSEDRAGLLPSQALSDLGIERVPKVPDTSRSDIHARRRAVPTKTTQVLPAGVDRTQEIEPRNRPCAAPPLPVGNRDQDRRTMDPFDDPRGDDADHTRVPTLALEHDAEILGGVERLLQLLDGLL